MNTELLMDIDEHLQLLDNIVDLEGQDVADTVLVHNNG